MKKLALSLLLSTALITKNLVGVVSTDLGPLQLITNSGSNTFAAGEVNLSGIINIGQSSGDTITIIGSDITPGGNTGNTNIITVMSVDSGNHIVAGSLVQLGSAGNNIITCPAGTGNLTITSANSGNIVLSSDVNINIVSNNIVNPGVSPVLLSIDTSGNIYTSNGNGLFVFGNSDASDTAFISVDNSVSSPTGIILSTELTSASDIFLNAGSNNIMLASGGITLPTSGNTKFLMIDSSGNIQTPSSVTPVTCGSLTAAGTAGETISLGISSSNFLGFTNNSGDVSLKAIASGAKLKLSASSNINVVASGINPTGNSSPAYTVLALDRSGDLVTSEQSQVFIFGNNAVNANNVTIDNNTQANGIAINSQALYLIGQGLAPASGFTNTLTIDDNGKIGIIVSSAKYKEDIKTLSLDDNSFDSLEAVSYKYKGKDTVEYGFIAESLVKNDSLKNAVIYAKDGSAMSVNYQAVFVALTAQFLKTKKELNEKVKSLESQIAHKDEILLALEEKYSKLELAIAEIAQRIVSQK
jgi:hypothetical protein